MRARLKREEGTEMNEEKREENFNCSANEKARPQINKKDLALSLAAVLLSGCVLSGAIPSAWIGLAGAALIVYMIIAIKNIGAIIQILLASVLATVLTFLPVVGTAALALIIGTGVLSWLFMTLPKYKWTPVLLLILAYGLGFLVTSNPISPLLSLAFLPAAALMAWAHARDIGRTNTVLHALLGFVLTVLAALCVLLWRTYGGVNYDILMRFINELKQLFVTVGTEAGRLLWESLESASMQTTVPAESWQKLQEMYAEVFGESNLRTVADLLMGLAPALVTVPAIIIAYLANVVLLRKYYNTEWRSSMTPAACSLTVGPATGVIYFVCFLIFMFASKTNVFTLAVSNMCFILMPGLCLTGVNVILFNARRARGWMGVAHILLLVAAVCCLGATGFYFVALWGAYAAISAALHQKIIEKMKDQNQK